MSDRAHLSVTIYACPPEHRAAVQAVLVGADEVEGDEHTWEEKVLGADQTYANALLEISPWIAFQVSQDAKYESDGRTTISVPYLGTFVGDLSASGQIIATHGQIAAAITAAGADVPALLAAVDALHGGRFTRALAALAAGQTQEPPLVTV